MDSKEDEWKYDYNFLYELTDKVHMLEFGEGLSMEEVEAVLIAIDYKLLNNNSDGWIAAIDVLKDGNYLVYNPNAFGLDKREVARYSSYNESWYQGSDCIHPTHYQLLPSPPIQQPKI